MADLNFIDQIAPLIKREAELRGYKVCSAVISQAILESNWGKSSLSAKYHNYFGLKAGNAWVKAGKPYVNMKTMEEYTYGNLTQITDGFRSFPSMGEGVKGYYDFISTKRYANLKNATTAQQYLEFIKADGYATSSSYVKNCMAIVNKYNLTKYDSVMNVVDSNNRVIKNVVSVNTSLNVRNQPNITGKIVGSLLNGDIVNIIGYENGWYNIATNKWVSAKYIKSNSGTVVVKTRLNLRALPTTSSAIIGGMANGCKLKLLDYKDKFYLVLTEDNQFGWCSMNYVNVI